jgi:hypothetical protein
MLKPLSEFVKDKQKTYQKLMEGKVDFQIKVKSKSRPGLYHYVTTYIDGSIQCDCEKYFFTHIPCRHILLVEKWLETHPKPNKK